MMPVVRMGLCTAQSTVQVPTALALTGPHLGHRDYRDLA